MIKIQKLFCGLLLGVSFFIGGIASALAAEAVQSLRGDQTVENSSVPAEVIKWQHEADPVPRSYFSQPPLIPHRVQGYTINLKFNKCLTCHSPANYKVSVATRVSPTHFYGRDRKKTQQVAARRYFCLQCHVPQSEAKPLVENSYKPKS